MLFRYLVRHWPSVIFGNILALILGLAAALVAAMIGPSIQLLMNAASEKNQAVSVTELFGSHLGWLFEKLSGLARIDASTFLWQLPTIILCLAGIKGIVGLLQWFLWERAGELISKEMRSDVMSEYAYLNPAKRIESETLNEEETLSSVLSTDIKLTREYIVRFYGGLPREGLQVVFLTVSLILLSPKLFMVFAFFIAPLVLMVSRLGRKLRRRMGAALQDYSELSEWLQKRLYGIETIKHYRTELTEAAKMKALNDSMYDRFLRAAKVKARTSPLIEVVSVFGIAFVVYFALQQIESGEASGALQLSFFSTLALLSQAANKVGHYFNSNREGSAAIERIENVRKFLRSEYLAQLPTPELEVGSAGEMSLQMQGIGFSYKNAKTPALDSMSYEFHGGKIYCLTGPSGGGKTTLFKILLGLLKLQKGYLKVKSADMALKKDELFSYMPQKVMLAPASVLENVAYPNTNVDVERAKAAIKAVGLEKVVVGLDQGYETIIGSDGRTLSGGQSQRVQLARICYHDNPIILVDEGTSALDPESEAIIYKILQGMAKSGKLVIMIAHRLSATKISDEILLLKKGRLEAVKGSS